MSCPDAIKCKKCEEFQMRYCAVCICADQGAAKLPVIKFGDQKKKSDILIRPLHFTYPAKAGGHVFHLLFSDFQL